LFGWWAVDNTCCCSHCCFDDAVWQFSLAHASDGAAFLLPCKLFNRTTFVSVVTIVIIVIDSSETAAQCVCYEFYLHHFQRALVRVAIAQ
jgi:hypothetical protein